MKPTFPRPLPGQLKLERLDAVRRRTGLSRSQIYRMAALGSFPKPLKLGERMSAWDASEVDAWIRSRIALREHKGHHQ